MQNFVNINNSYVIVGDGTAINPYNWTTFINLLSQSNLCDTDYFLAGIRILSAGTDFTLSANSVISTPPIPVTTKVLTSGTDPWRIILTSGNLCIVTNGYNKFYLSGGMIETISGNISVNNTYTSYWDNCHIKSSKDLIFKGIISPFITDSNIVVQNTVHIYSLPSTWMNNIIDIGDGIIENNYKFNADNCAFTSANSYYNFKQQMLLSGASQFSLPKPIAFTKSVSALNTTDLNYITTDFSAVSVSGHRQMDDNGNHIHTESWFGGKRDGIGALYFPDITPVVTSAFSANGSNISANCIMLSAINFSWNPTIFSTYIASNINIDFNDGNRVSTTSAVTSAYTYTIYNTPVLPSMTVSSFNNWYTVNSNTININLTLPESSATFVVWNTTSATITSANTNDELMLHNTTISSGVYAYSWNLGNGIITNTTSMVQLSSIPNYDISYPFANLYKPTLTINSAVSSTSAYVVISRVPKTYYVNINNTTIIGSGTSAYPFNFTLL